MPPEPGATAPDLFEDARHRLSLAEGAALLGGFALPVEAPLLAALEAVVAEAPFRRMVTPGLSSAMKRLCMAAPTRSIPVRISGSYT